MAVDPSLEGAVPSKFRHAMKRLVSASSDHRRHVPAPPSISFWQLYKYASRKALAFTVLGTLASLLNSTLMPLMFLIYGSTTDEFVNDRICRILDHVNISSICPPYVDLGNFDQQYFRCNLTGAGIEVPADQDLIENVSRQSIYFALIGLATLIFATTQIAAFSYACELIVLDVRRLLMSSVLRQPVSWFDSTDAGALNTYLVDCVGKFRNGVGDKIGLIVQALGTCVVAGVIGLAKGWKLSLIMLSASPPIIVSSALATVVTVRSTNAETRAYAAAGSVAEQAIRNVRTVQAFGGQRAMLDKYASHLDEAKREGIKKTALNGLMLSSLWFVMFATYALGFWYGSKLVRAGEFTIGALLAVFLGMQTAIFSLGNALPHLTAANEARAVGHRIYGLIEAEPEASAGGVPPLDLSAGDIVFDKVSFAYPTRPEAKVLDDFSLRLPAHKITALVGESGCGKSTLVQLLLRFYQPDEGAISVGGRDIRSFDLHAFRRGMGLVSQEPALFSASVGDNVRLGRKDATDEEIEQACRTANAHEFIRRLPDGYSTFVGESGSTLSGGQKQRIAIARALIADPGILLLDEATSALDAESEKRVQETLEEASKGRTTVVIAHRLSTVRNADLIVAMDAGRVVEMGSHDELMARDDGGVYSRLVRANRGAEEVKPAAVRVKQRAGSSRLGSSAAADDATSDDSETDSPITAAVRGRRVAAFMFAMNRPELVYIVAGCVCCAGFGLMQTLFELYFAEVVVLFSNCDPVLREDGVDRVCLVFLVFAIMSALSQIGSSFCFGVSGETLTKRLRAALFDLLMRYDVSFFERNSVGALCTMLASEASAVHGSTGIRVGVVLSNFCILGTGAVLALVYGWELALVIAAFIPLIIASTVLSVRLTSSYDAAEKRGLELAGHIAQEATANIRTAKQLNLETHFATQYNSAVLAAFRPTRALVNGALFGFSQAVIYFTLATGYYAGAHFVAMHRLNTLDMMVVFAGMLFASMAVGQNQAMAPEHARSKAAARRIYLMLQRKPSEEVDSMSEQGLVPKTFEGHIELRRVSFAYPTRAGSAAATAALTSVDIDVKSSANVALVGPSGSGKSTVVQLLQRYYDPTDGEILVDGVNLKQLNVQWYRRQLGLVSQEPVLFDWSIAENIAFGDTTRSNIPIEDVRFAAIMANADEFVCKLPNGYDTRVGSKGTLISGGQKQRICIARALIRKPKMLLLDEATSALDAESERLVQNAIEAAQKTSGSVTVAHKLKTVEKSDQILVMKNGKVVEKGKHEELVEREGGIYADLYRLSNR